MASVGKEKEIDVVSEGTMDYVDYKDEKNQAAALYDKMKPTDAIETVSI